MRRGDQNPGNILTWTIALKDLKDASDGHGAAADISGSVLGDTSGWFFLNYLSLNDYF